MLNTLFLVDEIFTGESKQYKIVDGKYELFESRRNQKESDGVTKRTMKRTTRHYRHA